MKVNPQKSVHITFTLRKSSSPTVFLNNIPLPVANVVKYLVLTADSLETRTHSLKDKRSIEDTNYY
jgi:hypothetical protein